MLKHHLSTYKQRRGLKRTVDAASEPVTLTEAKSHLRVDHSDDDTYITGLITAARNIAENYTNSSFFTQTWVATMEWFTEVIELRRGPVQSVSSLKYYDSSNTLQTFDASGYFVDTNQDIPTIEADNNWPSALYDRIDAIQVTYVTGYATVGAIPQAIKHAILMIIGHLYENRQDVVVGSQVNQMPQASRTLLNPYVLTHQYEC